MRTIRHGDTGNEVVIARLLTGKLPIYVKVRDIDGLVQTYSKFDADFVAHVISWQSNHGLTGDGVIGPDTWAAIAKNAPTCSTGKNRKSAMTLAVQLLIDSNLTADGIFGPRTKAAVVVWQSVHGLKADGIVGPKTWAALLGEDTTQMGSTTFKQPVDYKQGDSRWGKKVYSSHGDKSQTMSNSGCGPTAAADVIATLVDPSVTPWTLAQLAMEWGDRTYNSGTAWSFFKHLADHFDFQKFIQTASIDALKACLDAGGYVVCSMGPGYWTKSGHFICAWKYENGVIYANDPASGSRTHQSEKDFISQRKQFFCFYPLPAESKESTLKDVLYTINPVRGEKIVDISKYQPTVDYDALAGDTALIILRAGRRGTGGGISIDECFIKHAEALKKRNVPFGVYFYSLATNEGMAYSEAVAFHDYAAAYEPLFWAIDAEQPVNTQAAIKAFAETMRAIGVTRIGAYIANQHYNDYGFSRIADLFDFAWIPKYSSTRPAYKCDLWQYTSTGRVNGIDGNVDLDRLTGDGHSLNWFLGGDD